MTLRQFEKLVARVIDELPAVFRDKLDGVGLEVREWPSRREMEEMQVEDRRDLFGYQQGVNELERSVSMPYELPRRIVIFKGPHEAAFEDPVELRDEVRKTVLHEIGHHLGMNEDQIDELGYG
jgi:predicted Zn-dependent protease with MMP-like domain